jgi:hypothetical protein
VELAERLGLMPTKWGRAETAEGGPFQECADRGTHMRTCPRGPHVATNRLRPHPAAGGLCAAHCAASALYSAWSEAMQLWQAYSFVPSVQALLAYDIVVNAIRLEKQQVAPRRPAVARGLVHAPLPSRHRRQR